MQSLTLKMLFRKKGIASAIIAIALLIALLAAVNCLLNNINAETTTLNTLSSIGQTFLVTSKNASSLYDSQINQTLISQLRNCSNVNYATAQQLTAATLTTENGSFSVQVRAVDDMQAFLINRQAYVNGSISQNASEADIGIILAQLTSVNKNDVVALSINNKTAQLKIVGIIQTNQQSDSELIMPLSQLQLLTRENGTVSFAEFSLKNLGSVNMALGNVTQTLPEDVKVTNLQQTANFAKDLNAQAVNFVSVWSISIYVVVIGASYVMAARLVDEAKHDLYILRALGIKKDDAFNLIVTHALTIAFIGTVIGLSLGIVGAQVVATAVRWIWGNSQLAPFLQPQEAFEIVLLSLLSSFLGGIYPALKAARDGVKEA